MNNLEIKIDSNKINENLEDDLFIQAFEFVNEAGFVSCSMLQRKYSI